MEALHGESSPFHCYFKRALLDSLLALVFSLMAVVCYWMAQQWMLSRQKKARYEPSFIDVLSDIVFMCSTSNRTVISPTPLSGWSRPGSDTVHPKPSQKWPSTWMSMDDVGSVVTTVRLRNNLDVNSMYEETWRHGPNIVLPSPLCIRLWQRGPSMLRL